MVRSISKRESALSAEQLGRTSLPTSLLEHWRTGHERDTAKTFENIGGGRNADIFAPCTLERPTLLSLAECSVFTLYRSAAAKKGNFPIQGSERPSRRWGGRTGHERDTAKTLENIGGGRNADKFPPGTLERPTLLSLAECSVFTLYRSAAAKKGNFPIQCK